MSYITVTNNVKSIQIPFEEGEMTSAALTRVLDFKTPCHGNGTCGRCRFDIVKEDGSHVTQLACRYKAREMTIYMPVIKLLKKDE